MEIVKDIEAIIGLLLSLASIIALCTKKGREIIRRIVTKNTADLQDAYRQHSKDIADIKQSLISLNVKVDNITQNYDSIKEVMMQDCRNIIKNIYYKYHTDKCIPLYERKTADITYNIYHDKFNGNSYIKLLYTEICKWEIDTITYPELEE